MANSMVLIADSQEASRRVLKNTLGSEYSLLEAATGEEALGLMRQYGQQLAAVVLDLALTDKMDGYGILKQWHEDAQIRDIPAIAVSGCEDARSGAESLEAGAWDFIQRPYEPQMLCFRVRSVIERSELRTLKHIQYIREYDELTGIYNQSMFLQKTGEMLQRYPKEQFAFIHLDIYQFHLVNQFYGISEADRLLQYIAGVLADVAGDFGHFTYGRYLADVFCFCMPYGGEEAVIHTIRKIREKISQYQLEHVLVPIFGIYLVDHTEKNVITVSDRANLAAKQCKGNYIKNYAFYDSSINDQIIKEQQVINTMKAALAQEQFVLYIQPKYDLHMDAINGGEVLVRWKMPGKGIVPPGEFIPIFERNGFIMKLDYYIWEHACQIIRRWLDEGKKPFPISVNISRVSFYNTKLAEVILELVQKYGIEPGLLQLELTESAYTSNPGMIKETMSQLQSYGFCILMDDFGSGYSSLNTLKDIAVDILKVDMNFLTDSDMPGRGENILASVVRMAKWLNMPVIAEGVEKESQVAFLRSIGCEFVQGYYFAKPMPINEYEQLAFNGFEFHKEETDGEGNGPDKFWDASSQMDLLFANMLQAVAIYEYEPVEKSVDTIRVNDSYYDLFGYRDLDRIGKGIQSTVEPACRESVIGAFEAATRSKGAAQCEFHRTKEDGSGQWIEMNLKYVGAIGNRSVIFATMADITSQKEIEQELRRYRKAILSSESKVETILVVDDIRMNRRILRNMFESEYNILEAENGVEALEIVRKNSSQIDLVLLDVMMPVMDGREFLRRMKEDVTIAHIPVVIITSDDSPQQQINALSLGANDYVVKPFIPEVVIRRVCNVLESRRRIGEVLQNTDLCSVQEHLGLYNRNAVGQIVCDALEKKDGLQALLLVDIDNARQVSGRYGQAVSDKVIQDFADKLRGCFRKSDILARYGGDEFIVFAIDVPSREFIEKKCDALIQEMHQLLQGETQLECSVGIAVEAAGNGQAFFMELIGHADKALDRARQKGKNQWYLYEGK